MSFFSRLWRLLRANANDLVSRAEDPAKILDQALMDMQADLVKLRQAVATSVASQKRVERQASQARSQADQWYGRAQLALQGGDEELAREALARRKTHMDTAQTLGQQLESQAGQVETLKRSLLKLEGKIAQAKTRKDTLKARAQAAQAQKQLEGAVSGMSTDSSMAAFERMEEKVESLEAETAAVTELAGENLEARFEAMEGSDVDQDLAALKASMAPAPALPLLPDNRKATPRQAQLDDELAAQGRSAQAKTRKDTLKARVQAAQAQKQLEGAVSGMSTYSSMTAFERMEEKVESLEAETAVVPELAGENLEARFEAGDELAALRRSMDLPPN